MIIRNPVNFIQNEANGWNKLCFQKKSRIALRLYFRNSVEQFSSLCKLGSRTADTRELGNRHSDAEGNVN